MPGIAERGTGVETAGDGVSDEGPALLGQQPEHPLLRHHQRIQPRCLAIEVVGDGALSLTRRSRVSNNTKLFGCKVAELCWPHSL